MERGFCHEYEIKTLLDFIRGEMKRQKITQQAAHGSPQAARELRLATDVAAGYLITLMLWVEPSL